MALGFLSGWFKLPKLKCEATMDPLGADESLLKKKYKNKISVQSYLHPSSMPTRRLSKKYFGDFQSHAFLTMHNYHHQEVVMPIPDQGIKLNSHQEGLK